MNAKATLFLCAGFLAAAPALAQHGGHGSAAGPYAGLQDREIKALSEEETRSLLDAQGMRMALAAELNGYPGPAHVLEHAQALALTPSQLAASRSLMEAHKAQARALGERAVAAERALDRAFAARALSEADVDRWTAEIARLQGELRASHLRTHLRQTALLTPAQVDRYQQLRGYAAGRPHGGGHR
ncbi:MAG: hypothetical protein K0R89_2145 [Ramlibacter sp.]|jgi:Spy/CpxP family protein refolding chaperone|nr:hypothetical protein [Ramlibacter sp.]